MKAAERHTMERNRSERASLVRENKQMRVEDQLSKCMRRDLRRSELASIRQEKKAAQKALRERVSREKRALQEAMKLEKAREQSAAQVRAQRYRRQIMKDPNHPKKWLNAYQVFCFRTYDKIGRR